MVVPVKSHREVQDDPPAHAGDVEPGVELRLYPGRGKGSDSGGDVHPLPLVDRLGRPVTVPFPSRPNHVDRFPRRHLAESGGEPRPGNLDHFLPKIPLEWRRAVPPPSIHEHVDHPTVFGKERAQRLPLGRRRPRERASGRTEDLHAVRAASKARRARFRAERFPYNRAQNEVRTSVMSRTRSSSSSRSSTTINRRPDAASAASMYSEPKRVRRSRCSTTIAPMVGSLNSARSRER